MSPVRILCIETALSGCSACIAEDEKLLAQATCDIPNAASEKLPGLVDDVLKKGGVLFHDLHAIAVSNGPGSYTGLRIGVAAAKGYAYAWQLPILAIPTLQIMATAARDRHQALADIYVPAIDARRNEIFWAMYNNQLDSIVAASPLIIDEHTKNLFDSGQNYCLLGTGAQKLWDALALPNTLLLPEANCLSSDMITPAFTAFYGNQLADPAYLEPSYTKAFYYPPYYIKKN
jgi:tRNA threonylcarbamoyladenosine biosynthesis protein TsaB